MTGKLESDKAEKRKVAIIANLDLTIYNFRKELVEELLRNKYEVHLLVPYGERIEGLIKQGCVHHEIAVDRHGKNPFNDIKTLLQIHTMLKRITPQIVFTYTIKPNIYGGIVCRLLKIPYAVNITGLGSALENNGIIQAITVLLYKIALKRAQRIFFQNKENELLFGKMGIGIKNADVLPGSGVNLKHFYLQPYPAQEKTEFAFIARIMKEKGIDEYLYAAQLLKSKYQRACFHVYGFCEEKYEDILKEKEREGIIQFHGMVDDMREELRTIHCVVLPSHHEGMSNSLLEAASCGRPLIASDISGCREIISDGENGLLVHVKDKTDLVLKMEKFIELPYEAKREMGAKARSWVEKRFDRDIVVKRYMNEVKERENER